MASFADEAYERMLRRSFSYSSSIVSRSSSATLSDCELEDDDDFFAGVEHMLLSEPLKPPWFDSNRAAVNVVEPNSTELIHTQRDAQHDDGQMQLPLTRCKLKLRALCHSRSADALERATNQPVTESLMCSRLPSRRRTLSVEFAASVKSERTVVQPVPEIQPLPESLRRQRAARHQVVDARSLWSLPQG